MVTTTPVTGGNPLKAVVVVVATVVVVVVATVVVVVEGADVVVVAGTVDAVVGVLVVVEAMVVVVLVDVESPGLHAATLNPTIRIVIRFNRIPCPRLKDCQSRSFS